MKTAEELAEPWRNVPPATHLVTIGGQGATLLCETHMQAMRLTCNAAAVPMEIFELPADEEPVVCQACHLAEVNRPRIILH